MRLFVTGFAAEMAGILLKEITPLSGVGSLDETSNRTHTPFQQERLPFRGSAPPDVIVRSSSNVCKDRNKRSDSDRYRRSALHWDEIFRFGLAFILKGDFIPCSYQPIKALGCRSG